VLVVAISGDRGLAGAYNTNIIRFVTQRFDHFEVPVRYIAIGRKGVICFYGVGSRLLQSSPIFRQHLPSRMFQPSAG